MLTTIKRGNVTWINVESPTAKEISDLAGEFSIHPLTAEELTSPTLRPKADVYKDSIYLILHFPVFNSIRQANDNCEIDFVIGKNFLITTTYQCVEPLQDFLEKNRKFSDQSEKYFENHAGHLVYFLLKELYEYSLRQLDHIQLKLNKLEEQIFNGSEKETLKKISGLKRDVLDFRRAIAPHEGVLKSFEEHGKIIFGKEYELYLNVLLGEHAKVKNLMEGSKEIIEALYETNESLLSIKTNEIMKNLTLMAFVTFPLMLVSAIFSMNTISEPIVGKPGDFWIIICIMAVATAGMFFFFRHKKWL